MPIREQADTAPPTLATSREPISPTKKNAKDRASVGDQALMDAIAVVVIAWLVVFFLAWTLRSHNI